MGAREAALRLCLISSHSGCPSTAYVLDLADGLAHLVGGVPPDPGDDPVDGRAQAESSRRIPGTSGVSSLWGAARVMRPSAGPGCGLVALGFDHRPAGLCLVSLCFSLDCARSGRRELIERRGRLREPPTPRVDARPNGNGHRNFNCGHAVGESMQGSTSDRRRRHRHRHRAREHRGFASAAGEPRSRRMAQCSAPRSTCSRRRPSATGSARTAPWPPRRLHPGRSSANGTLNTTAIDNWIEPGRACGIQLGVRVRLDDLLRPGRTRSCPPAPSRRVPGVSYAARPVPGRQACSYAIDNEAASQAHSGRDRGRLPSSCDARPPRRSR